MASRVKIIQGYPDPGQCGLPALKFDPSMWLAAQDFPILRTKADWVAGQPPECIRQSQDAIAWADHLVLLFPPWLGGVPALLTAEGVPKEVFRPQLEKLGTKHPCIRRDRHRGIAGWNAPGTLAHGDAEARRAGPMRATSSDCPNGVNS